MEILRDAPGIQLTQRKYDLDLLKETGFFVCKPTATPMDTTVKLCNGDSELLSGNFTYISVIGILLYLTITMPNLSFFYAAVVTILDKPIVFHWRPMHRVLWYMKSAPGQVLLFKASNETCLSTYSDSDWADCLETRRSITYLHFSWVILGFLEI